MEYTSAEANKLLRKLNEEYNAILAKENKSKTFVATLSEDPEAIRPEYNYHTIQCKLEELQQKIRLIKHAINQFNVNQPVPGFEHLTIDQMLVYIPQLTAHKKKLLAMANQLPRERLDQRKRANINIVEYVFANYDADVVSEDLTRVSDELAKAQNALDIVNTTIKFSIEDI